MMNPQDFINKHNNQYVGTKNPNTGHFECVPLWEQYNADNGWGFIGDDYAKNLIQILQKLPSNHWQVIINNPNDPNQLPIGGDWFIFGGQPWNGNGGHVGMIVSAAPKSFVGFEQNNPLGSPAHEVTHATANPYAGMLGWLRPKAQIVPVSEPVPVSNGWAHVNSWCNVRAEPHVNARITSQLAPNSTFAYVGAVSGDSVGGNSRWIKSALGHYVWSGNLTV